MPADVSGITRNGKTPITRALGNSWNSIRASKCWAGWISHINDFQSKMPGGKINLIVLMVDAPSIDAEVVVVSGLVDADSHRMSRIRYVQCTEAVPGVGHVEQIAGLSHFSKSR